MAKNNILTRSKKLKAAQCHQNGQLQEADALYQSFCQIDPVGAQAWVLRGVYSANQVCTPRRKGTAGEPCNCNPDWAAPTKNWEPPWKVRASMTKPWADIATFHRTFRLRRITGDLMNKLNQGNRYFISIVLLARIESGSFKKIIIHNNEHVNHAA